jgi:hypothetical protein
MSLTLKSVPVLVSIILINCPTPPSILIGPVSSTLNVMVLTDAVADPPVNLMVGCPPVLVAGVITIFLLISDVVFSFQLFIKLFFVLIV